MIMVSNILRTRLAREPCDQCSLDCGGVAGGKLPMVQRVRGGTVVHVARRRHVSRRQKLVFAPTQIVKVVELRGSMLTAMGESSLSLRLLVIHRKRLREFTTRRTKELYIRCPNLYSVGAAAVERLTFLPFTKANRVQSPAGSLPDFRMWESCRMRCRWSAGFLGDLPFPPPFHSGAPPYSPQSPSSAFKTTLLRAAQISSLNVFDCDGFAWLPCGVDSPLTSGGRVVVEVVVQSSRCQRWIDMQYCYVRMFDFVALPVGRALISPVTEEGEADIRKGSPLRARARLYVARRARGLAACRGQGQGRRGDRCLDRSPWRPAPAPADVPNPLFSYCSFLSCHLREKEYPLGVVQPHGPFLLSGAAVTKRLDCPPSTKANRVQSPAGSLPDSRKWESCRTMPLVGGVFNGDLPFPPPLHSGAAPFSLRSTLIGSQDLVVKSRPNLSAQHKRSNCDIDFIMVRLLAFLLGEPGSSPGGAAPGLSHVGIASNDAAGRRVFSGISSSPCPSIPHPTVIGSQDLGVKSRSNLYSITTPP
ncbi:hypothetical protein PR048_000558 [Dryococelus australis]|uniref:Uncharacterized protein n=1 Tax=Dryococelus australis TaxID=614101 RepID=A0ABQ9IEZ6_9NEOP|nr:hypothetical protein PR048_000558 [Dryococelus australis]